MPHHEIVALERVLQPLPAALHFPAGTTYALSEHWRADPDPALVAARVRHATVIIVTTLPLDAALLAPHVTPRLQLVAVMATGTDCVDVDACRARGVRVVNCPAANLDAVSEHALGLYFAARRRTVVLDRATRAVPSDWMRHGSLVGKLRFADGHAPLTCGEETLGVIGYGGLGRRIAHLGRALGMQVLVAARKNAAPAPARPDEPARESFAHVLRKSTVLVLAVPRNPHTLNLLSAPEFEAMTPHAVVINVSRGGIVDEHAVVAALKHGRIAGYATDVFDTEPLAGPADSPLLSDEASDLNITMSPHLAWFAQRTLDNLGQILDETIKAWAYGEPINVVV